MNKERGKLGSCFDYQMTGTVLGLCADRPCPDHISTPWLQLLSRFALRRSTLSFAGPQRNWVFAFYICFVHVSDDFFPWGLGLIRGCMHISSTDKKQPSCLLKALPGTAVWCHLYYIYECFGDKQTLLFLSTSFGADMLFICGTHERYKHVINTTLPAHRAIKEERI